MTRIHFRLLPVLLLALGLMLSACKTTRETTDDEPRALPQPTEEPEPEPEEEPEAEPEEEEEPAGPRTVRGFRVQLLTTKSKTDADQLAAEAESKWPDRPVEVAWKAPYYRVRLGAFASRGAANRALADLKEQYPEAFVVPDMVTIYPR